MGTLKAALSALFSQNTTNAASQQNALVPIVKYQNSQYQVIGADSMANLASVLGGIIYSTCIKEATTVTDMDAETGDSKSISSFFVSTQSSPVNLPDGVNSTRFFFEVYNMSNYYIIQKIYIPQANNFVAYARCKFGNNNWVNWKTIA